MQVKQSKAVTCFRCKAEHPESHYDRVVHNKCDLHGPWDGWRMAGKDLVSPQGDRINAHRLAGFLWVERAKSRLYQRGSSAPVRTIDTLPARERFAGSA